jgi:hypothetical protein
MRRALIQAAPFSAAIASIGLVILLAGDCAAAALCRLTAQVTPDNDICLNSMIAAP